MRLGGGGGGGRAVDGVRASAKCAILSRIEGLVALELKASLNCSAGPSAMVLENDVWVACFFNHFSQTLSKKFSQKDAGVHEVASHPAHLEEELNRAQSLLSSPSWIGRVAGDWSFNACTCNRLAARSQATSLHVGSRTSQCAHCGS